MQVEPPPLGDGKEDGKLGVEVAVATPKGYEIPEVMRGVIDEASQSTSNPGKLIETNVPEEAVKNADILVTDTWVSMGQEEETATVSV